MFAALVDGIRNERAVGVPRRFSIGTLFILLTLYCVLFRVLVLFGADVVWTSLVCSFFAAVTTGQMVLFRGEHPRAASIVAGATVCPLLFLGLLADEYAAQWSGWELSNEVPGPMGYVTILLLLMMVGWGLGYLVGCASAGVFYVIARVRPQAGIEVIANPEQVPPTLRISEWVLRVGSLVSPVQVVHPVRGACAILLICVIFGVLLAPFVSGLATQHVVLIAFVIGTLLAGLSGNFQLWFFWPAALMIVGIASAPWSAEALNQVAFYREVFRQSPETLTNLVLVLGGLLGLVISAGIGWTQWLLLRNRERKSFTLRAFVMALIAMLMLSGLIANRLEAWSRSPKQSLFNKAFEGGGYIGFWDVWSGFLQRFRALHLTSNCSDADFLQLLPHISDRPYAIELHGDGFTDQAVQAMDGFQLEGLTLSGTAITDNAFEKLTDLSASYTSVMGASQFGDRGLRSLVALPSMSKVVTQLVLDKTSITDGGLAHLQACKSVQVLSLNECNITDVGLGHLAAIPNLVQLSLRGCSVTDEGMATLARMPRLQVLNLENTAITDRGLRTLVTSPSLRQIRLTGADVTEAGVAAVPNRMSAFWDPGSGPARTSD